MDSELFDLCKSVYEKTTWGNTQDFMLKVNSGLDSEYISRRESNPVDLETFDEYGDDGAPLYTSDYLLEKLPKSIEEFGGDTFYLSIGYTPDGKVSIASYSNPDVGKIYQLKASADTPLKALLKLTIALHEAGELSSKEKDDV